MAEIQGQQGGQFELPPLQWDREIGKGQYANGVSFVSSGDEVVMDFSLRTVRTSAIPGESLVAGAEHIHIARIIMSLKTARELRDVLNRTLPQNEESDDDTA